MWDLASGEELRNMGGLTLAPGRTPWGLLACFFVWIACWLLCGYLRAKTSPAESRDHCMAPGVYLVTFATAYAFANGIAIVHLAHVGHTNVAGLLPLSGLALIGCIWGAIASGRRPERRSTLLSIFAVLLLFSIAGFNLLLLLGEMGSAG